MLFCLKNIFKNVIIFRPSVVFGPEDNFTNKFAQMASISPFIPLINSGKTNFQPVYVKDIAKAARLVLKSKSFNGKVYNLGGGRQNSCSILEAINLIEKLSKIKGDYKILKKNRIGDHLWWITDNSKFKKDYPNWKIKISLLKNLEQMVSFEIDK